MAPQIILDSHIHLWPQNAASSTSHGWMEPGQHLTRQYSIEDYIAAFSPKPEPPVSAESKEVDVKGFVYIETDRVVKEDKGEDVLSWAAEPLREIAFLRRIVEGTPEEGETGFSSSHSGLLKGIVAWAPLDRGIVGFQQYLAAAREVAGEETWKRIRGCRYLLQGIRDREEFEKLAEGKEFVDLLRLLGEEGWSFDVGVDQRSGGIWQLFSFAEVVGKVHDGVSSRDQTVFILSEFLPMISFVGRSLERSWRWLTSMT
jgi:L-rhamnono-1,4-lactonase